MSVRELTDLFTAWLADASPDADHPTEAPGVARLTRLLHARPDLCDPPPADLASLAARALTSTSLTRVLDELDRPHLQVMEAVCSAQCDTAARLAHLLQASPAPGAPLARILHRLEGLALLLPGRAAGTWTAPAPVRAVVGNHALRLGRPAAGLGRDPAGLPVSREKTERRLRGHPLVGDRPEVLTALEQTLSELQADPTVRLSELPRPVGQVLLDTGLLVPIHAPAPDGDLAEHPVEAALAWRDGTAGEPLAIDPPAAPGRTVPDPLSRNASLAAVTDLLRQCDRLLTALDQGLPTLRSGGVGVREARRLAARAGMELQHVGGLVELLAAAGLTVQDPDTARWIPGPTAHRWRQADRARQWEVLALGWLTCTRAPLAGAVPGADAAAAPSRLLAPDRASPEAPRMRSVLLRVAAAACAYRGVVLADALPDRLRWQHPRLHERLRPWVASQVEEMTLLGLAGAGTLTELGALTARGDLAAARAHLESLLPAPLTRVRLQGDLTAVAPGHLDPRVSGPLGAMADPEGEGPAALFRFSDRSVGRALAGGWTAERILSFLQQASADPLPQALEYLVRDAARGHSAGAGTQGGVPDGGPSPDEGASPEGGVQDTAEDDDGAWPDGVRLLGRVPDHRRIEEIVGRLRAAPRPGPSGPAGGPELAVAVLRAAALGGQPVRLELVTARGERQTREVVPVAVAGGRLRCRPQSADALSGETVLPLHRVVSAEPVLREEP